MPMMAWFSLPCVSHSWITLSATDSSLASSKRTISLVASGCIYHFEAIIKKQLMANNTQNQRCKLVGVANERCFIATYVLFAGNPAIWSDCLFKYQGRIQERIRHI